MQKILLFLLLTVSTLIASEIGIVHGLDPNGDGFLSLRKKPRSTEIGRLYNGDKVEILGRRGEWYKVKDLRYNRIGWSHSNWIRIDYYASRDYTSKKKKSQKVVSYYAKLSHQDHYNARTGKKITDVAYIIQQDRANYHKYYKRDSEDTGDSLFNTIENRKRIKGMITRGNISWQLKNEILNGTPYVKVTVRGDSMDIEHIGSVSHSNDTKTTNNYKKNAYESPKKDDDKKNSYKSQQKDKEIALPTAKDNTAALENTDNSRENEKTETVSDQINAFLPYLVFIGIPLGLFGLIRIRSSKRTCPNCKSVNQEIKVSEKIIGKEDLEGHTTGNDQRSGSNKDVKETYETTYMCTECKHQWIERSTSKGKKRE